MQDHQLPKLKSGMMPSSVHEQAIAAVQKLSGGKIQVVSVRSCLVPRPHYYGRPMRFGSRGPRKFLRPRQTRRSETFCLTWGGAFGSERAVNYFSSLMKDVQQPWRVQNRA